MLMNNGQNTRSYSPVPSEMSNSRTSAMEDPKEKLKELVKSQLAHEVIAALTFADLAGAYWKMGLEGHKHKFYHMACKELKENFDWRKYYHDVFDETPHVNIEYEAKESPKSIDEIYNRLYELHLKNKENLHAMLKVTSENHMYTDMKLLLKAYAHCEEYEEKLESKMKRAQIFGYDVAHILSEDDRLKCEYKEHEHKEEK